MSEPQAVMRDPQAVMRDIEAQIAAIPIDDVRAQVRQHVFGKSASRPSRPSHPRPPAGAVPLNSLAGLACLFPGIRKHHAE